MHRAVALIAIVLVTGAGACLFDAGERPGEDLCFAVAVTPVAVLGFILTLAGAPQPPVALASPLFRPDFPAPPPRA
jgi:hypothetical protein